LKKAIWSCFASLSRVHQMSQVVKNQSWGKDSPHSNV
jgi:hypothetical protein